MANRTEGAQATQARAGLQDPGQTEQPVPPVDAPPLQDELVGQGGHDLPGGPTDPEGPDGGPPHPAAPGARHRAVLPMLMAVASPRHDEEAAQQGVASNPEEDSVVIHLDGGGQASLTVAIIGAGPAGFSALEALMQAAPDVLRRLRVVMIDDVPSDKLGRGAPFSRAPGAGADLLFMNMFTPSVQINKKTGLVQGWVQALGTVTLSDFLLRRHVGDGLAARTTEILRNAAAASLEVSIIRGRVVDVWPGQDETFNVDARHSDGGRTVIKAHATILAIGNEGSSRYESLKGPHFIDAPWSPDAGIHLISPDMVVAVAGASLGGMDACSVLDDQGHRGRIHMFSPSGRLPGIRPLHEPKELLILAPDRLQDVLAKESLPLTMDALVRLIERELEAHGEHLDTIRQRLQDYLTMSPLEFLIRDSGFTGRMSTIWSLQKSFDDVIALLWRVMDRDARRFVMKHLGTFAAIQWSAAPPTAHRVMRILHGQQLTVHRAGAAHRLDDGRFAVTREDGTTVFEADVFVDASGFAGSLAEFRNPLVASMRNRGLLTPDDMGGAKVRFEDGRLLDAEGQPTGPIWAGACALTRTTYLLSNELGEATHSAARAASSVAGYLLTLARRREFR